MIKISILAKFNYISNIADFVIVFIPFALIFSIINWILKPIILIQTYRHIIKNILMKYYDNKTKSFTSNQILIDFKQDKNLGYSIGHGTILNPRIENGEFKAILFDKYDFQWLNKEKLPNSET